MVHKYSIIVILVFLCCYFVKVSSEDVTVYVTVTANSTKEEATTTIESEISTPTVDVEKTEDYLHFEDALSQTNDDCMKHAYVVSLNLFHVNVVSNDNDICKNKYFDALENFRKLNPCGDTQFSYGIRYLDANIQLLCNEYKTGNHTILEDTGMSTGNEEKGKLCPIIHYLKTNYTKFQEELIIGCKQNNVTANDPTNTCIDGILKNYREMQNYRSKLNSENRKSITYDQGNNETVTIKINNTNTDEIFDLLSNKCPKYVNINDISSAMSITISFTTILIFSLFIVFINM
ncbi:hypothetical protein BCR36DRAFT_583761 [Piromyces finnis]|uniref:Uncharacterized protein n=1 Tax=Piromyces finnis TaxID=1754191 RepID=A0A1Y1V9J5_9FUNG|nr:hypothetical protein BCR36DRAFT_583761 [Piromyces finnis]|eukprot:ORX49695.1 hypothetical protein BCR36DRAFT_583761 [Piromyces finnis]